jgi:hypothetical protein
LSPNGSISGLCGKLSGLLIIDQAVGGAGATGQVFAARRILRCSELDKLPKSRSACLRGSLGHHSQSDLFKER